MTENSRDHYWLLVINRGFLHSITVLSNNSTRTRLGRNFCTFCVFVHPDLDSLTLLIGMWEVLVTFHLEKSVVCRECCFVKSYWISYCNACFFFLFLLSNSGEFGNWLDKILIKYIKIYMSKFQCKTNRACSSWPLFGQGEVCIQAKWPIRQVLISGSYVTWSSYRSIIFYSPLDGMLNHWRVIPLWVLIYTCTPGWD